MASATRSLIDPVGFWFSSFKKSWHRPVSICVISTSGVSPMSERIAGGFVELIDGAVGISSMLEKTERFGWIVDHDLVIAQKIIPDNALELRADRAGQHCKEIGHHDRHIVELCASDLE